MRHFTGVRNMSSHCWMLYNMNNMRVNQNLPHKYHRSCRRFVMISYDIIFIHDLIIHKPIKSSLIECGSVYHVLFLFLSVFSICPLTLISLPISAKLLPEMCQKLSTPPDVSFSAIDIYVLCSFQKIPHCTIFFPGLFFYVYIESPNPKNPEGSTPQAPNPIN